MAEMKEILVANLTLDTVRRNNIPPLIVPQGDYGARVIRAVITEQGKPVTVESAAAVSIVAERSGDGEALAFSGKVNADGSVTVPVTQWMLDVPENYVTCHIEATGIDYKYSTTHFLIEPEKKANPTEITPDDPRKDVVTEVLAGEKERVLAEGIRRTNENTRKSAEEARVRAEEQRLTDEATRVANEAERVSSELSRDATFKGWANDIASLPSFDSRISANSDRLTNIEAGLPSSVWHVDDTVARVKDVPENARPKAIVSKIGGMTYRDDTTNTLRSAKVTEVKSVGVNLIPYTYNFTTITKGGITITAHRDGSFTIDGASTGFTWTVLSNIKTEVGKQYTGKAYACPLGANMYLYYDDNDALPFSDNAATTTAKQNAYDIVLAVGEGNTYNNVRIYPMLNKGSTAKPYTPYVEHILPIPEELRPANGINAEVYDSIELNENGSVTKRVKCGVVDLGTLNWGYTSEFLRFHAKLPTDIVNKTYNEEHSVCSLKYNDTVYYDTHRTNGYCISKGEMLVRDSAYTDAATFKAAMSGMMLVYELAEPEVTDNYADLIIDVEGGGTLTFEDEYGYDMPNTVTYMLKEVTA